MSGEMFELAATPERLAELTRGVETAVRKSFFDDHKRDGAVIHTQEEVKRRAKICVDVARVLRHDLQWSVSRIVDELPNALRARIDGTPWDPSKLRSVWSPG